MMQTLLKPAPRACVRGVHIFRPVRNTAHMRTKWAAFLIFCAYVLALAALTAPARAGAEDERVSLPIVMYHHISADPARSGDYVITPATLEADLEYLRDAGYTSVSAAQLTAWSRGEARLPEKPVMITFDDAQESFRTYALPLLEEYGMCAVVAVVGQYADEYTASGDTNEAYAYMSWDAIGEISASGRVEIASHTQAMHNAAGARRGCMINPGEDEAEYFRALDADLAQVEASIERATGEKPSVFAFPFGFACGEAMQVLAQRGYTVAFTCEERVNRLSGAGAELMRLGRFNRPAVVGSEEFFAGWGS